MSKRTTWIVVVAVIVVLAGVYIAVRGIPTAQKAEEAKAFKAGMVTDIGGLGDQSFNDAAYRGLEKAKSELGAEINVVESKKMDDYEPNLRSLGDQKYDITWAIGFLMTDAMNNVAPQYPDLKFGIIDSVVEQPNVASATFKEHEGSYLLGIIAASMTKTGTVGFVGGMDVPVIEKFEVGYLAGVRTVNPDVKVLIGYTGKFDDPAKGKEVALAQFSQGADIVYHASGACGIGVIEAAKEKGAGFWAMGVDSCQHHLAPDNVMSCMLKRVDVAVYDVTAKVKDGTFEAAHYEYGLKEDGVGPCDETSKHVPQDVLDKVNAYKAKIVGGELVIPATRADLETFTPPAL
ncbi:MAG: BMP family ABC transporter substrate-binding protein [Firmicutes bacterium]|jgi:basic membrane protein A|nr:BMP family ABC transporter substrate-binding protein [Bacillota bacterium]MDH7496488.1 BMP family ABC transporter substrate-binding protein [Bacillota bacterium]